jgi:hypothetical protein
LYAKYIGAGINIDRVERNRECVEKYKYEKDGKVVDSNDVTSYVDIMLLSIDNRRHAFISHVSADYYIDDYAGNGRWVNQEELWPHSLIHIQKPAILYALERPLVDNKGNKLIDNKYRLSVYYFVISPSLPYFDCNNFMRGLFFPGTLKLYVKHFYDVPDSGQ